MERIFVTSRGKFQHTMHSLVYNHFKAVLTLNCNTWIHGFCQISFSQGPQPCVCENLCLHVIVGILIQPYNDPRIHLAMESNRSLVAEIFGVLSTLSSEIVIDLDKIDAFQSGEMYEVETRHIIIQIIRISLKGKPGIQSIILNWENNCFGVNRHRKQGSRIYSRLCITVFGLTPYFMITRASAFNSASLLLFILFLLIILFSNTDSHSVYVCISFFKSTQS